MYCARGGRRKGQADARGRPGVQRAVSGGRAEARRGAAPAAACPAPPPPRLIVVHVNRGLLVGLGVAERHFVGLGARQHGGAARQPLGGGAGHQGAAGHGQGRHHGGGRAAGVENGRRRTASGARCPPLFNPPPTDRPPPHGACCRPDASACDAARAMRWPVHLRSRGQHAGGGAAERRARERRHGSAAPRRLRAPCCAPVVSVLQRRLLR